MLRWFQALMPREDRFFALYNRHAQTLMQGAEALRQLWNEAGPRQVPDAEVAAVGAGGGASAAAMLLTRR